MMKILERTPVPVVPMALRDLWGAFFSRVDGAAMVRPFRRGIFSRVELVVGAPMAPAARSRRRCCASDARHAPRCCSRRAQA